MENNNQYMPPVQQAQPVQPVQQVQPAQPVQQVYQQPVQPVAYQPVQQAYQAQPQQPIDPNYAATAKDFLTKAIVSCAISTLPVGSIIAINMATKNRKNILDYIGRGGMHTERVKVSSALSRAGRYSGIGCTIFWGIYAAYIAIAFLVTIFAVIGSQF